METRVVVNGLRFAGAWRMLGFLEQQEPLGGTLVASRRHTNDAWCSDSRKMLFLVFFAEQEPPDIGFVPDIAVVRRSNYHYFSNFSIASL